MTELVAPAGVAEFREWLTQAGAAGRSVEVGGAFSKNSMGGPIADADVRLSTRKLNKLLAYEPADLTVSVEAGMSYRQLKETLAANNQFLPLDPAYPEEATVGGILATNSSGRRRRRYGAARDMLIGMEFATLEGKLVKSGGMVVKNVTGLDMGKLLIGSFGTLAAIVTANFKVFPRPERSATYSFSSNDVEALLAVRRTILQGVLQPVGIDWLNGKAAADVALASLHTLLVEVSGSDATVDRYRRELLGQATETVSVDTVDDEIWGRVGDFTARSLERNPDGAVIRVMTTASRMGQLLGVADDLGVPAVLRAGNPVGYLAVDGIEAARTALERLRGDGLIAVLESGSDRARRELELWRTSGAELDVMRRVKADFDPQGLLNGGRLFGVL